LWGNASGAGRDKIVARTLVNQLAARFCTVCLLACEKRGSAGVPLPDTRAATYSPSAGSSAIDLP